MMRLQNRSRHFASLWILALFGSSLIGAEPAADQAEFFEKKIRPALVRECYSCHSAGAPKLKGGLRADSRQGLLAGGDSGPALTPGQPGKSKLVEAIGYQNVELRMPPKGKLSESVIADLTAWVKMGAPWPGSAAPTAVAAETFSVEKRKARHWAWRLIQDGPTPAARDQDWPISPVDRFILAKLEAQNIRPAAPAAPNVLLRRVYFDLIGLPPSQSQIAEFEGAYSASPLQALEAIVDRLLASPQFGERWARHWLDLVRYAETRGHEFDPDIPNAWQYRDYVIRAVNADVPYNQFVVEHIAGDLLPEPRLHPTERFNESILGPGFWHLGEEVHSPVDIRADEADRFDNRIDVMSKTFLALTVACARCHDHKFDAIGTKDYYALYGFLRSCSYRQARFETIEANRRVMKQLRAARDQHRGPILKALADTLRPGVEKLPEMLREALASIASRKPSNDAIVRAWTTYLEKAKKRPDDPFFLIASGAGARGECQSLMADSVEPSESIVDYARLRPGDWRPDDVAFGFGPVKVGEPRFGADRSRPIVRFHEVAAADLDPAYRHLSVAPGTQKDYGRLGETNRAGRTLNTPSFTIKDGQVRFLVKGTGVLYAAVDAHTVVSGPLHAELIRPFNTAGRWQWVTCDLSGYTGHLAHLEFTPTDENDFAVARVVQGGSPGNPMPQRRADQASPMREQSLGSEQSLIDKQQHDCEAVLAALAHDALPKDGPKAAIMANWMLEHAQLLGVKNWDKVGAAAAPFLEEQARLTAQFRLQSRLAPSLLDGTGVDEHVFIRGGSHAPGEVVPRRFLEALAGPKGIESAGSGRLELARQMTDPDLNPFITRVYVNRVWHHLFGRGIVGSTDNFGVLGERPTHPELLDYLAARFAREGWSTKKLIRELVLSRAYQMSSHPDAVADAADPQNPLLHRMRLRRLDGEAIRDAMLSVSGRLDEAMYGPPVLVHLTPFLDGRGKPASGPIDGNGRRSLYIAVRRNFLSPLLLAFDTPSPFSTVGRRTVSNVPAQALILMNDPFAHQMADLWGKRLAAGPESAQHKIASMYLQAFARRPTDREVEACLAFLKTQSSSTERKLNDTKCWSELAHVLFNAKEFIFLE